MSEYVRLPAVAGQFYARTALRLREEIEACYRHRLGPGQVPQVNEDGPRLIVGLVSPHAGYYYSGPTATHGFHALAADGRPDTVVILGPAHSFGAAAAFIQTTGAWSTPLGETVIDSDLAAAILSACTVLDSGTSELAEEHSLEVQLPFLQHLYGAELRLVPIMMVAQDWATAHDVGASLAAACTGRNVVIVASTDMTHQMPAPVAREQDMRLVARMEQFDAQGLLEERARAGITMCGFGPTAAMLIAARGLGAREGKLLAYSTSGDIEPMARVVGYVSLAVTR